tara:strand:- start:2533 stop:3063 length:531 start_codon:yes stop_codon:yes gene_type:complete
MPKVGDQEFPYTPEGEAAAAQAAQNEPLVPDESKEMEAAVGGTAPMASEPLEPTRVNALAETLVAFVQDMAGGQVEIPPIPPVDAPLDQLPAPIYAALIAISAFLQETPVDGADQYQFDPSVLAVSNDGLAEASSILSAMMGDEQFKQQLTSTPASPEAPAPVEGGVSDEDLAALA